MTSVIEQEECRQVPFLRLPEVLERTGLSRSTIYVRLDHGRFPRPVPLGGHAVGWIESEVDEWTASGSPRAAAMRSESMTARPQRTQDNVLGIVLELTGLS